MFSSLRANSQVHYGQVVGPIKFGGGVPVRSPPRCADRAW